MEFEAYEELVRWMAALPLYAVAETEERPYLLVHAGIQTEAARAFCLSMVSIAVTAGERSMPIASCCGKCSPCSRPMTCCGFVTAIGMRRRDCFLPRARPGRGERPHAHGVAWALLRGWRLAGLG